MYLITQPKLKYVTKKTHMRRSHFCDFLQLSGSIVAPDFTQRKSRMEKLNKSLRMQLQVAEQCFNP